MTHLSTNSVYLTTHTPETAIHLIYTIAKLYLSWTYIYNSNCRAQAANANSTRGAKRGAREAGSPVIISPWYLYSGQSVMTWTSCTKQHVPRRSQAARLRCRWAPCARFLCIHSFYSVVQSSPTSPYGSPSPSFAANIP